MRVWHIGGSRIIQTRAVLLISIGKTPCIYPVVKDLSPTWENGGTLEILQRLKESCVTDRTKKLENSV